MNFTEGEKEPLKDKLSTYKMVLFDMDGVLVDTNKYRESSDNLGVGTWNVVFDSLGLLDEHQRLKNKFKAGDFPSYMEWTHEACEILKKNGLTEKKFLEIIDQQCFTLGAKEAVLELKKQGYRTAIITGSFSALAQRVQNEFGIDEAVAHCSLEFDKKGQLEKWKLLPCDSEGKIDALLRVSGKYGINPSECIFIGNDVNDIPVLRKAGLSIAFNSDKQKVRDAASIAIDDNDLRSILSKIIVLTNKK